MVAIPTTTERNQLSEAESARRAELEAIIVPGLTDCIKVGAALKEMSDSRLYRNTHSTFKDYVTETYKISVRRAYELVEAAEVVGSLPAECAESAQKLKPSQARELGKTPTAKRAKVLKVASAKAESESRPMTARDIREAAEPVTPPADPPVKSADAQLVEALGIETQPANYFAVMADEQVAEMIERCSQAQIGPMILALQALTMKAVARKKQLLVAA